jgi:hypothetical protein
MKLDWRSICYEEIDYHIKLLNVPRAPHDMNVTCGLSLRLISRKHVATSHGTTALPGSTCSSKRKAESSALRRQGINQLNHFMFWVAN